MPEMNYTEMLENIFEKNGDDFLEKGKEDIYYLSRWILPRLLLAKEIEPAREYLKAQINSFEPSKRIDIALKDWTMLSALSEIFNISAEKEVEQAVKYLSDSNDVFEDNHAVVQTALAFSFYLNNKDEFSKWRKRAMNLPFETGAEYIVFELLYLTGFEKNKELNAEHLANITAKIIYRVLTGAPFLSSAPHILVLAALFKNKKRLSDLLSGRIKKLDQIILNDKSESAVKFSKLKPEVSEKNGFPVLKFLTNVRGKGEIKPGCSDDGVLTYGFAPYLSNYAEKDESFETVIAFKKTKTVAEISLNEGVSISEKEFQFLKNRFALALEIAKSHIELTASNFELILKN